MDAFKCDGCGELFEGVASHSKDLDLGDDFMLRFSVARKQEPSEEELKHEQVVTGMPEAVGDALMALPFFKRKPDMLDGKVLYAADLCPACELAVLKRALVRAQTDSIAEALSESLGEIHE